MNSLKLSTKAQDPTVCCAPSCAPPELTHEAQQASALSPNTTTTGMPPASAAVPPSQPQAVAPPGQPQAAVPPSQPQAPGWGAWEQREFLFAHRDWQAVSDFLAAVVRGNA
ncbi:hypothetical protein Agub_g13113, partial [Astrephomene gubernaculifera]